MRRHAHKAGYVSLLVVLGWIEWRRKSSNKEAHYWKGAYEAAGRAAQQLRLQHRHLLIEHANLRSWIDDVTVRKRWPTDGNKR